MDVSIIKLQGHPFVTGEAVCADCGEDFHFTIPAVSFILWLPLCYTCGEYSEATKFLKELM